MEIKTTLNEEEASKYLKRGKTSLWRLRKQGLLAYFKYGNKILYRKEDLDEFLKQNYIPTFSHANEMI